MMRTVLNAASRWRLFTNWSIKVIKSLAVAGIAVGLAAAVSAAASLKDIRIGEYDAFTRIVFEFNQNISEHSVANPHPNDLEILFTGASPALTRRIPVERSRRIKTLRIWVKKNGLTADINFSDSQLRYETFTLKEPFRIALDVYSSLQSPQSDTSLQIEKAGQETAGQPYRSDSRDTVMPPEQGIQANQSRASRIQALESIDQKKLERLPAGNENAAAVPPPPAADSEDTNRIVPGIHTVGEDDVVKSSGKNDKIGLEYYLVITLIIITIIILALLVIMLLTKNRWSDEKKPVNVGEFLNNQDEKIAAINARIQEQLKRYDQA